MNQPREFAAANLVDAIKRNSGLTVASGSILIVAGVLAILSPFVAGLSITVMVGAMLALSGISQCFLAFRAGAFGRALVVFVVGVLMTIVRTRGSELCSFRRAIPR